LTAGAFGFLTLSHAKWQLIRITGAKSRRSVPAAATNPFQ
jgi:hypothetical protein